MEKIIAVKPVYELSIAGQNVTADISPFVCSVEYADKLEEAADEVQLVLDDVARVWQSDWYPQQGDTLTLKMGFEGNMLDCGLFEIDEMELSIPPDTITIKAIAAAIGKDLRTKNSKRYEKQSLRKIAQAIADKHGLTLMGDTSKIASIEVVSKAQDNESDLSFLAKLAKEYGIIFSVRGNDLIFLDPEKLEESDAISTITRPDVSRATFKDKTSGTFEAAVVSKRDTKSNTIKKWSLQGEAAAWRAKDDAIKNDPNLTPMEKATQRALLAVEVNKTKKDTIVVGGRAENESQAEAKSKGALREKNKDKLSGSFSVSGSPLLVSGVNVEMDGFGAFNGKWTVKESRHSISRDGGYTTDVSIRKGSYKK